MKIIKRSGAEETFDGKKIIVAMKRIPYREEIEQPDERHRPSGL